MTAVKDVKYVKTVINNNRKIETNYFGNGNSQNVKNFPNSYRRSVILRLVEILTTVKIVKNVKLNNNNKNI